MDAVDGGEIDTFLGLKRYIFAVEDGLEKQVADAARGKEEDMCKQAACSTKVRHPPALLRSVRACMCTHVCLHMYVYTDVCVHTHAPHSLLVTVGQANMQLPFVHCATPAAASRIL